MYLRGRQGGGRQGGGRLESVLHNRVFTVESLPLTRVRRSPPVVTHADGRSRQASSHGQQSQQAARRAYTVSGEYDVTST
mmetsp:Transcript_41820/g.83923  ORF Transcript_41820/g.83923 Transcript_41820/m.83923 type:complete len:80 (+) Transcript_41820:119-358(+)